MLTSESFTYGYVGIGAAFHGKSFAGAGLAVGKDGAVVALHDLAYQWSYDSLVHVILAGLWSKDAVEAERLGQGGVGLLLQHHLAGSGGVHYCVGPLIFLRLIQGPENRMS